MLIWQIFTILKQPVYISVNSHLQSDQIDKSTFYLCYQNIKLVAHKTGESLFLKLGEPLNWRKLYTNPKIWRIQDLLKAGHKIGEQDCYVV